MTPFSYLVKVNVIIYQLFIIYKTMKLFKQFTLLIYLIIFGILIKETSTKNYSVSLSDKIETYEGNGPLIFYLNSTNTIDDNEYFNIPLKYDVYGNGKGDANGKEDEDWTFD